MLRQIHCLQTRFKLWQNIVDHSVVRLVEQNEGNWENRLLVEATVKGVVTKNSIENENMQEYFISKQC